MPVCELADLIEGIVEPWTLTDENIARLVDRDDYYLRANYSQWISDPDDPEVKAERARRDKLGIKPPPEPILRPVARRPAAMTYDLVREYMTAQEKYYPPEKVTRDGRKKITIAELRAQQQ